MTGTGFDHAQFSLVGEGEQVLACENDIAGTIPVLTPLYHASLKLDALEWAVPIFFETEHAVQMTVVIDGSAPVIDHIIGLTPDLTAGKFTSLFADLIESGPHAIAGRAVNQITRDHRRGSGRYFVGKFLTPEFLTGFREQGNQTGLAEEDDLFDSVNLGEDGRGMGGELRSCFPFYFSGIFIKGEKGLFRPASVNDHQIIHDQGRAGVFPAWVDPGMLFENIDFPDEFSVLGG